MAEASEPKMSKQAIRIERSIEEYISAYGKIVSSTPGRIRLRLKREYRTADRMFLVKDRLESQPGVDKVTINQKTGSVLLLYDPEFHRGHAALEILKDLAFASEGFVEIAGEEEILEGEEGSGDRGQKIADAVYDFDVVVYERTGLRLHGYAIPVAIAAFGVYQLARYGLALEMLSGPLLLYLAYDVYRHIRKEPVLPGEAKSTEVTKTDMDGALAPLSA